MINAPREKSMAGVDVRERFARARSDGSLTILEGFHALKHAVRFDAEIGDVVTPDLAAVMALADELAPDVTAFLTASAVEIPREQFSELTARPPASPVLSIAATRRTELRGIEGTAVVLYEPRHAGNVGAAIRVAAAAGAQAVVVTGELDPWAPAVVRAAAGLHYALDIHQASWPLPIDVPIIAFDATGDETSPTPEDVAYLFGSERHGLPADVLAAASHVRRIPMREGVSSLNLATSVAVALYASGAVNSQPRSVSFT